MQINRILTFVNYNLEYIIFCVLAGILFILLTQRVWEGFITESLGINQLDAIIYINLENREDRKKLLLKELQSLDTNMSKVHKVSGIYMPQNGHKGCIQSHILALNMIKLNKLHWDRVLILEDDIQLTVEPNEFNDILSKALMKLDAIDDDWNVLMVATAWKVIHPLDNTINQSLEISIKHNNDKSNIPLKLERLKSATTSSAYIVKTSYIDKILNLFDTCNNNLKPDKLNANNYEPWALDQQWKTIQESDKWYCINIDPIKQREIWSTIMSESHK